MKTLAAVSLLLWPLLASTSLAQSHDALRSALTFHASFDTGLDADYSRGDKACYVRTKQGTVPAAFNEELKHLPGADGSEARCILRRRAPRVRSSRTRACSITTTRAGVPRCRSGCAWTRTRIWSPATATRCRSSQRREEGFIFLEWSKDESPRHFRFAIRPLEEIWNPNKLDWAKMTDAQRPAVNLPKAPFSREAWTHAVFTLESINDKTRKPVGRLYLNGELAGSIENWNLTLGWDPAQVALVLGASYVGHLDDLAVFNRALTGAEVKQLNGLKGGVRELRP
ncbi:MAG: LamG domain-containing protein [Rhodobacteraceae bacterium]|nr:LamG domain-containing protein [Paracoccaceae bacterium]